MRRYMTGAYRRMVLCLAAAGMATLSGCSLEDLVGTELPPTTTDPEALKTEEGALAMYRGSLWAFRRGFGGANTGYVVIAGQMTDELTTGAYVTASGVQALRPGELHELDSRTMPEDLLLRSSSVESWYRNINMGRNQAVDAIYYLKNFAPYQPVDLVGHMYAIRGMSMSFLADAFCSGIPLTDYRSPGGFTYMPGQTTEEVYQLAIAQYDSALASVPDSANYRNLALVGKARALLNLGEFQAAAQAVAQVPTSFKYKALYAQDYDGSFSNNYVWGIRDWSDPESSFGTIGDREGENGLPFASANDPRVKVVAAPRQSTTYPLTTYWVPSAMRPKAAPWNGTSTTTEKNGEDIVVASGIEARLIEAEVKAQANDPSYLSILNALRTTCTSAASCASPAPAGTGGVAGLPPLVDPGTKDARIKQVFDERGYWLFLTGVRQSDLRRLVRVYGWPQDEVYPTGFYPFGGQYGTYTNIPIPNSEAKINPKFEGCFDRDA